MQTLFGRVMFSGLNGEELAGSLLARCSKTSDGWLENNVCKVVKTVNILPPL